MTFLLLKINRVELVLRWRVTGLKFILLVFFFFFGQRDSNVAITMYSVKMMVTK